MASPVKALCEFVLSRYPLVEADLRTYERYVESLCQGGGADGGRVSGGVATSIEERVINAKDSDPDIRARRKFLAIVNRGLHQIPERDRQLLRQKYFSNPYGARSNAELESLDTPRETLRRRIETALARMERMLVQAWLVWDSGIKKVGLETHAKK